MNDSATFARQGSTYGSLRKAWIHWGHFSALRLLSGLCEANGLESHAQALARAESALQSAAQCVARSSIATERPRYARKISKSRLLTGYGDDLALALREASDKTGLGVGALCKALDDSWFRGIHEFGHLHFPESEERGAHAYKDTRETLASAHLASFGAIELRALFPSIRKATGAMRKAPLDWGPDAEVAMAMADLLPKLAPKAPRIGDEAVEFLDNLDIASGVHTPYFSIILPSKTGTLSAASSASEPFASESLTTKDLADAMRFQSFPEAAAHAQRLGAPSYAIVEIILAARGARAPSAAKNAELALDEALRKARMIIQAADSRYEKFAIMHALSQNSDFDKSFFGLTTSFCAAADPIGLYAPEGNTYYTPSKAYLGRDQKRLLAKLSHAHKGILIDYAIASARIVESRGLPDNCPLNRLIAQTTPPANPIAPTRNASRL